MKPDRKHASVGRFAKFITGRCGAGFIMELRNMLNIRIPLMPAS